jgi:phosphatidylserine decarboxylase
MDPIRFFNRYTNTLETEAVYGEKFLRWAYGTSTGKITNWILSQRAWFSRFYGWRMKRAASIKKVRPFIDQYNVNEDEFLDSVSSFKSFNDFFIRKLKLDARPIDEESTAVFAADGRHLGFQEINRTDRIYAKGQSFDLSELIGSPHLAERYQGGSLVISRLCPVDYHRFHFPVNGQALATYLIAGPLYSVNPIALRKNIAQLFTNRRMLTAIDTINLGRVLFLEIGATCVGSIVQTYEPGKFIEKGDEKGYFEFGGSCVMTLFEPGKIKLAEDLVTQTSLGYELYARMGDRMGI